MAVRVPPKLPVPEQFKEPLYACMWTEPLQHQDELTAFLCWTQTLSPPLNFGTIVEIGSHRGGSLELWARLATQMVVSIDLPNGVGGGLSPDLMAERNHALYNKFGNVYGIAGDSHHTQTWKKMVELILKETGDLSVDLLFVDGDHTYEGVKNDYQMYRGVVRKGGVIAFHDVTCSEERSIRENLGVNRFWDELPQPKHVFSVNWEWGGIGAIVV